MTSEAPRQDQILKIVAGRWAADSTSRTTLDCGWEVRVAGLIPGDEVPVRVTHVSRGGRVAWARLAGAPPPNPARRLPPCQHAENCGACGLLHVADEEQLRLKVQSALPDLPSPLAETLLDNSSWIRSSQPLGYRHKAIFLPRVGRRGLELGGYARRTHEVIALTHCEVITPALRTARDQLRAILEPDVLSDDLDLRSVILRANQAGQVLATVILRREAQKALLKHLAKTVLAGTGPIVGLHVQIHEAEGDAVFGHGEVTHLGGAKFLQETVLGITFHIRPLAFFQVNPQVLEGILELLRERLSRAQRDGDKAGQPDSVEEQASLLLDLYCGGGVLGLGTLAERTDWDLLGIDVSVSSIEDAQGNAARLSPERVVFRAGPVADLLSSPELSRADAAILDPPRAGLQPAVLRTLSESGPEQILYVACSTRSLARDAKALLAAGYRAEFLCPADMMPQTPYVEWVAGFTREPAG